jgi:hypothetical protein
VLIRVHGTRDNRQTHRKRVLQLARCRYLAPPAFLTLERPPLELFLLPSRLVPERLYARVFWVERETALARIERVVNALKCEQRLCGAEVRLGRACVGADRGGAITQRRAKVPWQGFF